jgi:hypothetical protein
VAGGSTRCLADGARLERRRERGSIFADSIRAPGFRLSPSPIFLRTYACFISRPLLSRMSDSRADPTPAISVLRLNDPSHGCTHEPQSPIRNHSTTTEPLAIDSERRTGFRPRSGQKPARTAPSATIAHPNRTICNSRVPLPARAAAPLSEQTHFSSNGQASVPKRSLNRTQCP